MPSPTLYERGDYRNRILYHAWIVGTQDRRVIVGAMNMTIISDTAPNTILMWNQLAHYVTHSGRKIVGDKTKIEWATATWNPITGCTPVSAGCDHCYAKRMAERFGGPFGAFYPPRFVEGKLDEPLRWKKPRRIFVCSMSDFWHPDVSPCQRMLVFNTIRKCPQHTFMLLTKRAKEMHEDLTNNTMMIPFAFLPNVIGMVTAENQTAADERIPWLLKVPFVRRGVSVEPMLGPVDLDCLGPDGGPNAGWNVLTGRQPCCHDHPDRDIWRERLDWVICGGESGPGARPCHPDWISSLRDQCLTAHVPFFFKGFGEWANAGCPGFGKHHGIVHGLKSDGTIWPEWPDNEDADCLSIKRVGKKAAGCLLDGREWKEFPEVER